MSKSIRIHCTDAYRAAIEEIGESMRASGVSITPGAVVEVVVACIEAEAKRRKVRLPKRIEGHGGARPGAGVKPKTQTEEPRNG